MASTVFRILAGIFITGMLLFGLSMVTLSWQSSGSMKEFAFSLVFVSLWVVGMSLGVIFGLRQYF